MNETTILVNRLHQRLNEAFDELSAGFVDPREAYYDDAEGTAWLGLGGAGTAPGAAGPGFGSEQELAAIRQECRALAHSNEFAINGHENRVSYIVGPGHTYRAAAKKHTDGSPQAAAEVQRVVDEFLRVNQWHRRQQETILRLDRDGEAFLRFFVAPGGLTHVRFVEPGQIYAPVEAARDSSLSYGIATDPHDVETVTAYFIDGAPVDAAELQHRKANVDSNVKRGLPLFYPVRKNLRRAEKLLRNMSTVAEIQAAIALIRRHHDSSRTAVRQFVAHQGEAPIGPSGGRGGSARYGIANGGSIRRFAPGTILDAYGNVEYDFPAASLDAANYVAVLQAELRAIAARLVMPEFMLTSDASNGNYASTLVAESPALRMFARLQTAQASDDRAVLDRVIANAVAAGRLEPSVVDAIEIQIEPPSLAVRDTKQDAERRAIEFANGILSPQTWSQQSGLDYEQEQANLREFRRKHAL